jgi:alanine racemase
MSIQLRRRLAAFAGDTIEIWQAEHAVNGAVLATGWSREEVLNNLEQRVKAAITKFRANPDLQIA